RELHAGAVEDRPAPRGDLDALLVLAVRERREPARLHALDPQRAREQRGERDREEREQQADPVIRPLLAAGLHRRARLTYPIVDGSACTNPSRRRACAWMRPE